MKAAGEPEGRDKMELLDAMKKRRSVRSYSEERIPDDVLKTILEAGLYAPTSQNRKPCEFYVVRDRETLQKLAAVKKAGAGMLAVCDTAVAVFADSELADTWIEDASVALTYMHLMAAGLNVGSCWCQLHLRADAEGADAEEAARRILSVPERFRIVGILALGMPLKETKPRTLSDRDYARIHNVEPAKPQE